MAYINPDTGDRFEDWEAEQLAAERLDAVYGMVTIAGYTYYPSHVLKESDPIAYWTTIEDLIDAMELVPE